MIEMLLAADRLLADGSLDRAERIYGQISEADPRNAMAVVGLARVRLARGELAAAGEAVRRALEIDPEDAIARQLERELHGRPRVPAADAVSPTGPEPRPERRSWLARLLKRIGFG